MSSKNIEPQKRKQSGFDSFLPESSLPLAQSCLFTPQGDHFPRPKAISRKIFSDSKTYPVILTNGGDGEGEMGSKQDVGRHWKEWSEGSNERLHRLEDMRGMERSVPPLFFKSLLLSILNITVLIYSYIVLYPACHNGLPTSVSPFTLGSQIHPPYGCVVPLFTIIYWLP